MLELIVKILESLSENYMKTKYDWSNVPKEVKWISTDSDMFQVWFIGKPVKIHTHWFDENQIHYRVAKTPSQNEFKGNWQDSLEERPK